jgi:hypothetical protein
MELFGQIFTIAMLTFGLVMTFIALNGTRAGSKTLKERTQLIDWVFYHKNYKELLAMYEAVDWNKHYKANFYFRNPFLLYDPQLFSMFHLMIHGINEYNNDVKLGKKVICPYAPKSA